MPKMNVRFQYKADIRVDCSERLLSSESGHSAKFVEVLLSAKSGHSQGGHISFRKEQSNLADGVLNFLIFNI